MDTFKRVKGSASVAKLLAENGFKWKYDVNVTDTVARKGIQSVKIQPTSKTITVIYNPKHSVLSKTVAKYTSIQVPADTKKYMIWVNVKSSSHIQDYRKAK
uniref:Uncharacterized protein n=1 Tax=Clandestinovirus TaxID=2831644 RepID=A0A8F8KSP5_9VIRU|nr:hypothetical protein KOM_12_120 [Clandestinovirus]